METSKKKRKNAFCYSIALDESTDIIVLFAIFYANLLFDAIVYDAHYDKIVQNQHVYMYNVQYTHQIIGHLFGCRFRIQCTFLFMIMSLIVKLIYYTMCNMQCARFLTSFYEWHSLIEQHTD